MIFSKGQISYSFGYNDTAHFSKKNNNRSYYFDKAKGMWGMWTAGRKHSIQRKEREPFL